MFNARLQKDRKVDIAPRVKAPHALRFLVALGLVGGALLFALVPGARAEVDCDGPYSSEPDVIQDGTTGLTWTKGQVMEPGTWESANVHCLLLALAARKWRLPTVLELQTIVNEETHDPAINTTIFPSGGGTLWSATPVVGNPNAAWVVELGYGRPLPLDKAEAVMVRCVSTFQLGE